jgi:uncharacterized protein (DUF1800 family)
MQQAGIQGRNVGEESAKGQAKRTNDRMPLPTSLAAMDASLFDFEAAKHLLNRAGFGGLPRQVQVLQNWGLDKAVDYLVNYESVKTDEVRDDAFSKDIMRPNTAAERATLRRAERERDEDTVAEFRLKRQQAERDDREQMRKIQQWWMKLMIQTPRPLQEKLTLFWHGHFATSYRTIEDSYHMFRQNQFFRQNANRSFKTLLHGIIKDPAMLAYLDNNDSRKGRPNENLARELMELFSLGVGNYTEKDIKEGARALTGYTFEDDAFQMNKGNHDADHKSILGRSGNLDGEDFVNAILAKDACSRFIAGKLYRAFVHDFPIGDPAFDRAAQMCIVEMAQTLRGTEYNIGKVLNKVFRSAHFYHASVRNEQIKSPVQLLTSAIRSLGVPARDVGVLADASERMGQELFQPPSVKGWDGGKAWISTSSMFVRQNSMVFLLTGRKILGKDGLSDQEQFDGKSLLTQLADVYPGCTDDAQKAVDALLMFAIGRTDPVARGTIDAFMASRKDQLNKENLTDLMMLITALPEYQLC